VADVEATLVYQQRLAVLRALGLRMFRWLLRSTSLASARRELLAMVPVALATSVEAAEHGVPGAVTLPACGQPLQVALRASFKDLCREVVAMLGGEAGPSASDAGSSGDVHPPLLLAILHLLAVRYDEAMYSDVVACGLFPALFACLSRLEAHAKGTSVASSSSSSSSGSGGAPQGAAKQSAGAQGAAVSVQTSVWSLLDYLTSTLLSFNREVVTTASAGAGSAGGDGGLGPGTL
jgi:hypothetical protein